MTPGQQIDYEVLAQDAMRGIVRAVLSRIVKTGLPGEHHFYIAFNTQAPGVALSKRLKEKYKNEMTVVLQHRFWDLIVSDERFEVKLTFDGIPERLVVPFAAIKVFYDPSVPYGLQFEESELIGGTRRTAGNSDEARSLGDRDAGEDASEAGEPAAPRAVAATRLATERSDRKRERPARRGRTEQAETVANSEAAKIAEVVAGSTKPVLETLPPPPKPAEAAPAAANIVSLDAFRKK